MVTAVEQRIKIPANVNLTLEDGVVKARGENGELARPMAHPGVSMKKEGGELIIRAEYPNRRILALMGTYAAHIENMTKGVTEGFIYKMKVVYSHFPMAAKVSGKEFLVENYLGEKIPRKTAIVGNCSITIKGTEIEVHGNNIEEVGQTAANIERLTRVKKRDPRVFQDGIYLVERNGVKV